MRSITFDTICMLVVGYLHRRIQTLLDCIVVRLLNDLVLLIVSVADLNCEQYESTKEEKNQQIAFIIYIRGK